MRRVTFGEMHYHIHFGKRTAVAVGILLILSIPILVASQNDGLSWGFEAGQKLYFKETDLWMHNETTTSSLSFHFYLVTFDNYSIPDNLTYFPIARGETFFYNDTSVMTGYFSFAVPIGNWDLLGTSFLSLFSSYYNTIDIINDETSWGFQTTLNLTNNVETRKSIFSKTDGIIVLNLYEYANDIGFTSRSIIERVVPPFSVYNLALVTGGVVIFIIALGVYFIKRRNIS